MRKYLDLVILGPSTVSGLRFSTQLLLVKFEFVFEENITGDMEKARDFKDKLCRRLLFTRFKFAQVRLCPVAQAVGKRGLVESFFKPQVSQLFAEPVNHLLGGLLDQNVVSTLSLTEILPSEIVTLSGFTPPDSALFNQTRS